jgi:hypothetical protein
MNKEKKKQKKNGGQNQVKPFENQKLMTINIPLKTY